MIKTCFKCGIEKDIAGFYTHPAMKDGHLGKCKECCKMDEKLRRIENPEKLAAYEKTRSGRVSNRVHAAEWNKRYPERYRAHYQLTNAVRDGRIKKPINCEICGYIGIIHGHHRDYSKPFDVVWLCAKCHGQIQ